MTWGRETSNPELKWQTIKHIYISFVMAFLDHHTPALTNHTAILVTC